MRILLLNDTSGHANWGCQATSAGLKALIEGQHGDAVLESWVARTLPFRRFAPLRRWAEAPVRRAIRDNGDDPEPLARALRRFGFNPAALDGCDAAILNGEGMIHEKSGHAVRLVAAIELARRLGLRTAAVNQTVELDAGSEKSELVGAAYRKCPRVLAREPLSVATLHRLGVAQAELSPDAAFTAPAPDAATPPPDGLPPRFVALTGSSALKPGDTAAFGAMLNAVRTEYDAPAVMFASTKTDFALARGLGVPTVGPEVGYLSAWAGIGRAQALIGGRFHPMIFAARSGVPLLALAGNTWKNRGLMDLLEHPLGETDWCDGTEMRAKIREISRDGQRIAEALKARAERFNAGLHATPILCR